jgi:hypothetical protein
LKYKTQVRGHGSSVIHRFKLAHWHMQSYRVCACGVQSLTQGALNLNFKIEFSLTRNGNVIVIGTYYPFKMEIRSMQEGSRVYRRRIQTFSMRGARFFLEKKSDFKTICFKKNHRTLRNYSKWKLRNLVKRKMTKTAGPLLWICLCIYFGFILVVKVQN